MSHRRNGLRKEVTEAKKESPWSLGESQGQHAWGKGAGKGVGVSKETAASSQFLGHVATYTEMVRSHKKSLSIRTVSP